MAQPSSLAVNAQQLCTKAPTVATRVDGIRQPTNRPPRGARSCGQTKLGRWYMTSTLQGLFIDYSATFEHQGLGGQHAAREQTAADVVVFDARAEQPHGTEQARQWRNQHLADEEVPGEPGGVDGA